MMTMKKFLSAPRVRLPYRAGGNEHSTIRRKHNGHLYTDNGEVTTCHDADGHWVFSVKSQLWPFGLSAARRS